MRKIETKMNKAIRRGGNFSNGNTSVQTVSYLDSLGFYREVSHNGQRLDAKYSPNSINSHF